MISSSCESVLCNKFVICIANTNKNWYCEEYDDCKSAHV